MKVSSSHVNGFNSTTESTKVVTDAPKNPPRLEDISNPHELTAFVESLLAQLEGKFDDMSSQILGKRRSKYYPLLLIMRFGNNLPFASESDVHANRLTGNLHTRLDQCRSQQYTRLSSGGTNPTG